MTDTVSTSQRFTPHHPCPICGGHARLPGGEGRRCYGFLGSDGRYAHCTREESAGQLQREAESNTYAHRLHGPCRCGVQHGDPLPEPKPATVRRNGAGRHIAATYDYTDESGTLLYQTVRYDPKDFAQRQPDGRGGWVWSLKDVRRVLYRTPELLAADPVAWVLIVEGEKDANRLTELGFVATTNAMGASNWRPEYSEQLRGRRVCMVLDNDTPGERHAGIIAESLLGVASELRVLRLPSLPPGGDASDWLDTGGTAEALAKLVVYAPDWTSGNDADDVPADDASRPEPRFVWTLAELLSEEFPPAQPIVGGILDRAGATSLFGAGGAGKSWLSLSLSLSIATGTPWLDHFPVTQGRVLIIDQEGRPDRVQARLRRLCQIDALPPEAPMIYARPSGWRVDKASGYDHICALIDTHAPDLVVIDSGTRFHQADENKSQEMALVAQTLAELTTDRGIALLIVDHANKSSMSDDPRARLRGSTDKLNALDAAFYVERAVNSTTLNVTPVKSRYDVELTPFSIEFDHSEGRTCLRYQESVSTSATPDDALSAVARLSADDPYGATIDTIGFALFPTSLMTSSQRSYRTRHAVSLLERQNRIFRVDVPREGSRGGRKTAYQVREER